jgi:2,3-diketo-5-methylthio-1-phosphopentane phosphatase
MGWVLLLDFDGTVSPADVGSLILSHFAGDRWIPLNEAWDRGELTTPERAERQWAMVMADEAAVQALLERVHLDPHFPVLVDYCQGRHIPLWLVSDGFDFYIERILANHGLAGVPTLANRARWSAGRWRLEFPYQDQQGIPAGSWKADVVRRFQGRGARVAYAGDGLSDRAAAEIADRCFAKGRLADYCRKRCIPFEPFENLGQVHAGLRVLVEKVAGPTPVATPEGEMP